jgi:hypothetical protein
MKIRNLALAAAALAMPAGMVLATTGIASAEPATAVTFTGTLNATVTGSIKVVPPVTNTPSSGPVKFVTTRNFSNLSGSVTEGGATITGAKYTSTTTAPTGTTCTSLESGVPTGGAGKITYTATGGTVAATKISFATGSLVSTSPLTVGESNATVTGSFKNPSGSASSLTLVIKQSISGLLTSCGGTGVAKLTVTNKSTATIG